MMKRFIKEMDVKHVKNYNKPQMVLLSGYPGSGKTYVAKKLSKKYRFFLISTDYVRNYYYTYKDKIKSPKVISKKVSGITYLRLLKLLLSKKSFVFDKGVNTKKELEKMKFISNLFDYELTLIGMNSSDDENIDRISKRVLDYNMIDDSIIGDNVEYSTSYSDEAYNRIKRNKKIDLTYEDYDYLINNFGDKEELDGKIEDICDDFDYSLKKI